MRRAISAVLGFAALVFIQPGCGEPGGCSNDFDCKGERICSSGLCTGGTGSEGTSVLGPWRESDEDNEGFVFFPSGTAYITVECDCDAEEQWTYTRTETTINLEPVAGEALQIGSTQIEYEILDEDRIMLSWPDLAYSAELRRIPICAGNPRAEDCSIEGNVNLQ